MQTVNEILAQGIRIKHRLNDALWDAAFGLKTRGRIEPFELDIAQASLLQANAYQAAPYAVLSEVLNWLQARSLATHFMDIGCGKGRALFMAHRAGYSTLTGIDLSEDMCRSSQKNLYKKGLHHANIVRCDAKDHHFPKEACIFYMNNPFKNELLEHVSERLAQTAHPDSIVALTNPLRGRVCLRAGFREIGRLTSLNHNYITAFYERAHHEARFTSMPGPSIALAKRGHGKEKRYMG